MQNEYSRQISEKYSDTKFHENPPRGSRVVSCGHTDGRTVSQTDMMKLTAAFSNFSNASKKSFMRTERPHIA